MGKLKEINCQLTDAHDDGHWSLRESGFEQQRWDVGVSDAGADFVSESGSVDADQPPHGHVFDHGGTFVVHCGAEERRKCFRPPSDGHIGHPNRLATVHWLIQQATELRLQLADDKNTLSRPRSSHRNVARKATQLTEQTAYVSALKHNQVRTGPRKFSLETNQKCFKI